MMISPLTMLSFYIKQLYFQSFGRFPLTNVLLPSCDVIVNHIILFVWFQKSNHFLHKEKSENLEFYQKEQNNK